MRVDYRIIAISLFCGILFWVADAFIDHLYYKDQSSFFNLLIKGMPYYEFYLRLAIFAFFMLFGILMSRAVVKIRQAKLTLKESQENLKTQNELLNIIMESSEIEKRRLAVTLSSISDGVIMTDIESRIVLINKSAEELTGWTKEDASGRKIDEVFYIADENTEEQLENPAEIISETAKVFGFVKGMTLVTRDKTKYITFDSTSLVQNKDGITIGMVIVFHAVTESCRIEEELQKIDELESIITLAGKIAHDLNNILMSTMGNISLAMSYSDLDKIREKLLNAEKASLKAKDLTKQLLTFSKEELSKKN